MLINNKYDREVFGLDGLHYVQMIIDSMSRAIAGYRQSKGVHSENDDFEWQDFITDIVYLKMVKLKLMKRYSRSIVLDATRSRLRIRWKVKNLKRF